MDNSELHYMQCDPEKLWNKMIEAYVDAGGDILYPGDEKEMLSQLPFSFSSITFNSLIIPLISCTL